MLYSFLALLRVNEVFILLEILKWPLFDRRRTQVQRDNNGTGKADDGLLSLVTARPIRKSCRLGSKLGVRSPFFRALLIVIIIILAAEV